MRTDDFAYDLPPELIAQEPITPRDASRLMVVHRATGRVEHRRFVDLAQLLDPGDLLVANDSRVLAARLVGRKAGTGGRVESLLLRPAGDDTLWEALVRGRVEVGTQLEFGDGPGAELAVVEAVLADGRRVLRFTKPARRVLEQMGQVPLPPYISTTLDDPERYQTVYAREAGSAAAPTAGLHFTSRTLEALARRDLGLAFVTLHVGTDTFRPIESAVIEDHTMHSEWCRVPPATSHAIELTRAGGGRVVAIGTTAVRALESATGPEGPYEGWTALYITPGHVFRQVDALLTNFHLPRSSLLVLVAAFAGTELVTRAYRDAIHHRYRFYSFGDAMLIL